MPCAVLVCWFVFFFFFLFRGLQAFSVIVHFLPVPLRAVFSSSTPLKQGGASRIKLVMAFGLDLLLCLFAPVVFPCKWETLANRRGISVLLFT